MSLKDATIDLLTEHPTAGYVALIMIADDDWTSEDTPRLLEAKLNLYLHYALEGQLADDFPDLAMKPVRIQLDCVVAPPPSIVRLVGRMAEHCKALDVDFILNTLPPNGN